MAATPEEAALLGWAENPKAKAQVVRVELESEGAARVVIDAQPHQLEYVLCGRGPDGLSREVVSGGY